MIIVTGAYGFIGSNLVHALNAAGRHDLWVVDNLSNGRQFANLADATIGDYDDWRAFLPRLASRLARGERFDAVYHLGACADTVEWDGQKMMSMNFDFSRSLLDLCDANDIPFIYASSAAVYGLSEHCREIPACERPLNVYGYSKLAFDQHVRSRQGALRTRVVGLRYFNVYGPRERHKGRMASVVFHFDAQLRESGEVRLFGASHGRPPGGQERDFIHVDDIVDQTLWAGTECAVSGIFNAGTGCTATFNDVAEAVLAWHEGRGKITYIPFPDDLLGAYQYRTCADLERLRGAGYRRQARNVATGVKAYLDWLHA